MIMPFKIYSTLRVQKSYSIQGERFKIIYNKIILGLKNMSGGSRQFGVSELPYAAVSPLEFFY